MASIPVRVSQHWRPLAKAIQRNEGRKENEEGTKENGKNENVKFIAITDATQPIDLNVSHCPKKDPMESVLGSCKDHHSQKVHACDHTPKRFNAATNLNPINEEDTVHSESESSIPKKNPKESLDLPKPKDYSMRANMITERIKFEVLLDSIEEVDVWTKALVIIGKLVNVDPSRKMMAYHETDEDQFPILEKSQDLPEPIEHMSKYISAPMLNPKAKKLIFHTRFRSVTSLLEMKRDQEFMSWLKTSKIFTSVMTLNNTANTRAGFLLGKGPHFTNLQMFSEWVKRRIYKRTNECLDFQMNVEVISRFKDPSTKCCAIIVICSRDNADHLKEILDLVFHPQSDFPFTPFWVMYTLDARTQSALYKTHKARVHGEDMIEVGIPDFHDLDTQVLVCNQNTSLRDMCFDLKSSTSTNLFVDADDATHSGETIFQVTTAAKTEVQKAIDDWIKSNLHIQVKWNTDLQYKAKTYRLDPKSRSLASQLTAIANESLKPSTSQKLPPMQKKQVTPSPPTGAWVDLTRVKEPPNKLQDQTKLSTVEEATVTTLSESTCFSASASKQEAAEKFKKIGGNIRNLLYCHKKLKAGQECLEMGVILKMNQLFWCFELHHNRLERLEAARERHVAIQLQHIQLTLDPAAAQQNGTQKTLEKMVNREISRTAEDKKVFENNYHRTFESSNEDETEFLDRQAAAGRMLEFYNSKLEDTSTEEFDFNLDNFSEVSNEEMHLRTGESEENSAQEGTNDNNAMEIASQDDALDKHHHQDSLSPSTQQRETNADPSFVKSTNGAPDSWDSDEDDKDFPHSSNFIPKTPPQWKITPSCSPRLRNKQSPETSNSTLRSSKSHNHARRLFQKAFPSATPSNRFSALEEDHIQREEIMINTEEVQLDSMATYVKDDQLAQDSDYSGNAESDEESLDAMSLVSSSEIKGLVADQYDMNNDGYVTETTDNTSPSHKRKKPSGKSGVVAQERTTDFYSTPDSFDTSGRTADKQTIPTLHTQFPSSSHPSLNTPSPSKGHGTNVS